MEIIGKQAVRLQLDVSEEIKTWLKIRAIQEGVTLSELAEKAFRGYQQKVEKDGKNEPPNKNS